MVLSGVDRCVSRQHISDLAGKTATPKWESKRHSRLATPAQDAHHILSACGDKTPKLASNKTRNGHLNLYHHHYEHGQIRHVSA